MSDQGAGHTFIDGTDSGTCVTFSSGEGLDSIINGFTIQNGMIFGSAGGIECTSSSPKILNNIIKENDAGGIYCGSGADPEIIGNIIESNKALTGGGIRCFSSSPLIKDNIIQGNTAIRTGLYDTKGGGILCASGSMPTIIGNVIRNNVAEGDPGDYLLGGGIYSGGQSLPNVIANKIIGNTAEGGNGGGICIYTDSSAFISSNLIASNESADGAATSLFLINSYSR